MQQSMSSGSPAIGVLSGLIFDDGCEPFSLSLFSSSGLALTFEFRADSTAFYSFISFDLIASAAIFYILFMVTSSAGSSPSMISPSDPSARSAASSLIGSSLEFLRLATSDVSPTDDSAPKALSYLIDEVLGWGTGVVCSRG